jgi:hypothetical protein
VAQAFGHLFAFPEKLGRVGQVLPSAAAALAEVRTEGLDLIRRGRHNLQEPCLGEALADRGHLGPDGLSGQGPVAKDHEAVHPGQSRPPKASLDTVMSRIDPFSMFMRGVPRFVSHPRNS